MTENSINTAPTQPELEAVVHSSRAIVGGKSKASLADMFSTLVHLPDAPAADRRPPVPVPLTEAQSDALRLLPSIFGKTVVIKDRALTPAEVASLVEERDMIDTVLSALAPRKDKSIREVLANHFDHLLTDEQRADAPRDNAGHYAVKQELPVESLGRKVQRIVSGGKPRLTIEAVERLLADGKIDRKTYLQITKVPPTPRILDEGGIHKAIQKNPALFFLLGSVAEPTNPTTTIKVAKL